MSSTNNIVVIYRKFYRARNPDDMREASLPVVIAFDTLRDASRKLFDDQESLEEAIAGQVFQLAKRQGDDNDTAEFYSDMQAFAKAFLAALPPQAISDPGFIRKPFRDLVEGACAVLYRDAEKEAQPRLSVSQLAARANVRREYVIAEIRRGNIENVERLGLSYAIPESSAQKWLDNPRRGSRSSTN